MNEQYIKQVELLIRIIPELNKIPEFAMHGGTAINLFYHNMPRLSVDIDLTYLPFNTRRKDLQNINLLLKKLSGKLRQTIVGIEVRTGLNSDEEMKLFCEMNIVPESQLFGGKMVAALDRQHPRDIFDTKKMLDRINITEELMNINKLKQNNPEKYKNQIIELEKLLYM